MEKQFCCQIQTRIVVISNLFSLNLYEFWDLVFNISDAPKSHQRLPPISGATPLEAVGHRRKKTGTGATSAPSPPESIRSRMTGTYVKNR